MFRIRENAILKHNVIFGGHIGALSGPAAPLGPSPVSRRDAALAVTSGNPVRQVIICRLQEGRACKSPRPVVVLGWLLFARAGHAGGASTRLPALPLGFVASFLSDFDGSDSAATAPGDGLG